MKSGFAVLIGRSNVGKSTMLNNLIGSKVAITTPKAQTTRNAIHGIFNDDRGQIVFVDTPGVLQKRDLLTKHLLKLVHDSLKGIDVIIYVVDATREIGNEEHQVMRLVTEADSTAKKILCINKIDHRKAKLYIDFYRDLGESFDEVIEVSALRLTNLELLRQSIFEALPEGEPYYPEGQYTNLTNPELIAELIREKVFLRLDDELPYGVHVIVDEITERENGTLYIRARVITNEERHKRYIIGAGGRGIKEVGQSARKDLENITDRQVFLELQVEVDPRWLERIT